MGTDLTFKPYSERSKARRALVQVYNIPKDQTELYLDIVDLAHGFWLDAEKKPLLTPALVRKQADISADLGTAAQAVVEAAQQPEPVAAAEQQREEPEAPAPTSNAFASFAMSQLAGGAPLAPDSAREATPPDAQPMVESRAKGLKIQKNRETQNGITEPSIGGRCRAVWDALNNMMVHDEATGTATVPTAAMIRDHAIKHGWNLSNASIEYYQWRKFHGITGRGKKVV